MSRVTLLVSRQRQLSGERVKCYNSALVHKEMGL